MKQAGKAAGQVTRMAVLAALRAAKRQGAQGRQERGSPKPRAGLTGAPVPAVEPAPFPLPAPWEQDPRARHAAVRALRQSHGTIVGAAKRLGMNAETLHDAVYRDPELRHVLAQAQVAREVNRPYRDPASGDEDEHPNGAHDLLSVPHLLEVIARSDGILADIAREAGCNRHTVTSYAQKYPAVQEALVEARERLLDETEGRLYGQVRNDAPWAICFTLKTKAKHRGFVEHMQVTGPDGGPVQVSDPFTQALARAWEARERALKARPVQGQVLPPSSEVPPALP